MSRMPNQHVLDALDVLRVEYKGALDQAQRLQKELDEATAQVTKLETAIKSLESLVGPSSSESDGAPAADLLNEAPAVATVAPAYGSPADEDVPESLAPYLPIGGKRLKSKQMVRDL